MVLSSAAGVIADKPMHFFLERYAAAYRAEDAFVRLVLDGESAGIPNQHDGLASLLADAATRQVGLRGQSESQSQSQEPEPEPEPELALRAWLWPRWRWLRRRTRQ